MSKHADAPRAPRGGRGRGQLSAQRAAPRIHATSLRRVVMMGAGALGSLLGGKLARAIPVVLIGRARQLEAIREAGLRLEGLSNETVICGAQLALASSPLDLTPPLGAGDLVLLAVKAAQAAEAARELTAAAPQDVLLPLIALQNGTGYEDALRAALDGKWKLLHGVVHLGATWVAPGRVEDWGGEILLPDASAGRALAAALERAGLRARVVPDLETQRWEKIAFNCALNALSAILEVRNRETILEELRPVRRAVLREVHAVAVAAGIKLRTPEDLLVEFESRARASNNLNSMLQDLRHGKPTEIAFLNAAIAGHAPASGSAAPVNAFLAETIARLERARGDVPQRAVREEARAALKRLAQE